MHFKKSGIDSLWWYLISIYYLFIYNQQFIKDHVHIQNVHRTLKNAYDFTGQINRYFRPEICKAH